MSRSQYSTIKKVKLRFQKVYSQKGYIKTIYMVDGEWYKKICRYRKQIRLWWYKINAWLLLIVRWFSRQHVTTEEHQEDSVDKEVDVVEGATEAVPLVAK